MSLTKCLRKALPKSPGILSSKEIKTVSVIVNKYDSFYKNLKTFCLNNNILLGKPLEKAKYFYYYITPKDKAVSNFDALMATYTITIQAQTILEAKILGFILKTIVDHEYDTHNEYLRSLEKDGVRDDSYIPIQISKLNEPVGIFLNKPTKKSPIFEEKGSIVFNRKNIGEMINSPIHLLCKKTEIEDYIISFY